MNTWHNVSLREPCPICHKPDWCSLSNNGEVCVCRRVESPYPVKSGSGWIHRLRESACSRARSSESGIGDSPAIPRMPLPTPARVFAALKPDPALIAALATELDVAESALRTLDVRLDPLSGAAAFPMRAADGAVTGIRYRARGTGSKWSWRGSRDGLFFDASAESPAAIAAAAPAVRKARGEIVVCEGASDAAALLTVFDGEGERPTILARASCRSGVALMREYLRLRAAAKDAPATALTIVADDDAPGREGAMALGVALRMPFRMVLPPIGYKDVRAWYAAEKFTKDDFRRLAHASQWFRAR